MKDVAQDVAEDVLGAEGRGVKIFIVKSCPSPSASGGSHAALALR